MKLHIFHLPAGLTPPSKQPSSLPTSSIDHDPIYPHIPFVIADIADTLPVHAPLSTSKSGRLRLGQMSGREALKAYNKPAGTYKFPKPETHSVLQVCSKRLWLLFAIAFTIWVMAQAPCSCSWKRL